LLCVTQTPDGGYLIGGNTDAGISGDKTQTSKGLTDYWIIKTDSLGNKEWDKDFGGEDQDYFSWLEVTADGDFIIGGSSYSDISGDKTQETWGYILNSYTNDADFWILKLDAAGNKLWDKDFGGDSGDYLSRFSVTDDNGYLLSGISGSYISGDKTEFNFGTVEMWMLKLNFFGNKQWDKTARTGTCYSYTQTAFAVQTKDGCYIMAENLDFDIGGDKTQANWGNTSEDFWSIKFCDTTVATPIISADQTLCEKFCTGFYDQSTNNPTAWQWFFPGGVPAFSTAINPTNICYYTPGSYDVTLITTNANGNDTVTLSNYMTVNATPAIPTITQNNYTLTCSPASQYQWQQNAVNILGATNQSYDVLQTGLYTVIVGDANECVNAASQYVLIDGIMESNGSEKFSIFPNPSHGIFFIQWQVALSNTPVTIEVMNALGKIVFSKTEIIPSASLTEKIELQNATPGIYVVEISSTDGVMRRMIIIE
ncbi:MAG: T9SS type A sorting domain-containing protein, partial [Chitinophagales bacterium]|nr:T9SS type A sorting domain-containing protein [Chitinophagales bacterium]